MSEHANFTVQYGYSVIRPQSLVRIEYVPPAPPTIWDRLRPVVWGGSVLLGAVVACVAASVAVPELAGQLGFVIGLIAFVVWQEGRR